MRKKVQKITTQKKSNYKDYIYLGKERQDNLKSQPQRSFEILNVEQHQQRKASTRIGFIVSIVALGIILIALATLLMWSLVPSKVLDINDGKDIVAAEKTQKLEGQSYIVLNIKFCKMTDSQGLVERFLVGKEQEIKLPIYEDTIKKQCGQVDAPTPIPNFAPDGTYYIRYKVTYNVNPIKTVVEEFKTEKFTHTN